MSYDRLLFDPRQTVSTVTISYAAKITQHTITQKYFLTAIYFHRFTRCVICLTLGDKNKETLKMEMNIYWVVIFLELRLELFRMLAHTSSQGDYKVDFTNLKIKESGWNKDIKLGTQNSVRKYEMRTGTQQVPY